MTDALPIDEALPRLTEALTAHRRAVLQAPPGAGKTTRVPLALLSGGLVRGRIVMLEPRRLAARAAALRMAETLGEPVGRTVGYRMRGETRVSAATRIEVVTEGILTRMIQADPNLAGIGALIFDEFHERSLAADLGLALAWEVRGALRDDLVVLVMSATLDAAPVAALLDEAPVITSEGRAYPVETRWLDRPRPRERRFEDAAADLVRHAAEVAEGGVLAFLPGEAEIRRVAARLDLPGCDVRPLYGALGPAAQRAALAPSAARKVVLATSIAETSLTIPGIRVVVDCGLARRSRFDPGSGMSRLVTERVTRAEADQRRGRAGRVAAGICFRMWSRGEEGALAAQPPAEIEAADLAGLALELALWGDRDGTGLAFLTPPPSGALAEAQALLRQLGALSAEGAITDHGRVLAGLPLHPRLGHMLALGGAEAAPLAALLADRDPLRGAPADLMLRLDALAGRDRGGEADPRHLDRLRAEAGRLARTAARLSAAPPTSHDPAGGHDPARAPDAPEREARRDRPEGHRAGAATPASAPKAAPGTGGAPSSSGRPGRPAPGAAGAAPRGHAASGRGAGAGTPLDPERAAVLAALAYPDRIGLRRPGEAPRFVLSGGKGAALDAADPLAGTRLVVVTDTDGDPREARIRVAIAISDGALREVHGDLIDTVASCAWSRRARRVVATVQERFGALVLSERPWREVPAEAATAAMLDGVREIGLVWTEAARRFRARVELARAGGIALPEMTDEALLATLGEWLAPHLGGIRSEAAWRAFDLAPALAAMLDWPAARRLEAAAPATYATPLGRRMPVDYDGAQPAVAVRLQEMFGLTEHPRVAGQPLQVTLLSPAGRPVQTTADLPGFWASSYADVRREMRGRYPRHPWPEDPAASSPTLRAKPRR